jgi:hypothetical protein
MSSICRRVANPLVMVKTRAATHTPIATPSRELIRSNMYTTRETMAKIWTTIGEDDVASPPCHQRMDSNVGMRKERDRPLCTYVYE